jgi:hypothetical protein
VDCPEQAVVLAVVPVAARASQQGDQGAALRCRLWSADHPEPQVGGVRGLDHVGALEPDLAAQVLEQPGAAAEENRGEAELDLVQQADGEACWAALAPCTPTTLSPAAAFACSTALWMPSVTKVKTDGARTVSGAGGL